MYIHGSKSHAERLIDLNFSTIMKEMKIDKFMITANGGLVEKSYANVVNQPLSDSAKRRRSVSDINIASPESSSPAHQRARTDPPTWNNPSTSPNVKRTQSTPLRATTSVPSPPRSRAAEAPRGHGVNSASAKNLMERERRIRNKMERITFLEHMT